MYRSTALTSTTRTITVGSGDRPHAAPREGLVPDQATLRPTATSERAATENERSTYSMDELTVGRRRPPIGIMIAVGAGLGTAAGVVLGGGAGIAFGAGIGVAISAAWDAHRPPP